VAVLQLVDHDTQGVHRLHDFSKAHQLVPGQAHCGDGAKSTAPINFA
jgi:hypothetical protein